MFFDEIGERVDSRLAPSSEVTEVVRDEALSRPVGDAEQVLTAPVIILKETMRDGPSDRTLGATLIGEERIATLDHDLSVVNLVTSENRSVSHLSTGLCKYLLLLERGMGRKQAKTFDPPRRALHFIVDHATEHLVTTADSENRLARSRSARQSRSEPARPQPGEITHRGAGTRQDHQVTVAHLFGSVNRADNHPRLINERIEVG